MFSMLHLGATSEGRGMNEGLGCPAKICLVFF